MTVKIVTDSTSDLSPRVAQELGITVVPVYMRFGEEVYRDGVDISQDEFYQKLVESSVHPSTAAPSPGEFAKVYEEAARETNEIVSIHVTKKHSDVYDAALLGMACPPKIGPPEMRDSCRITTGGNSRENRTR